MPRRVLGTHPHQVGRENEFVGFATVGSSYTAPAYPKATQILNKDGSVASIVGYGTCKKCSGQGWILNFGGNYKPCKKCNPNVCDKCMGTRWNFKKEAPCK